MAQPGRCARRDARAATPRWRRQARGAPRSDRRHGDVSPRAASRSSMRRSLARAGVPRGAARARADARRTRSSRRRLKPAGLVGVPTGIDRQRLLRGPLLPAPRAFHVTPTGRHANRLPVVKTEDAAQFLSQSGLARLLEVAVDVGSLAKLRNCFRPLPLMRSLPSREGVIVGPLRRTPPSPKPVA